MHCTLIVYTRSWSPLRAASRVALRDPVIDPQGRVETAPARTSPDWLSRIETIRQTGPVSTLIEWDDQIPPLARLIEESRRASAIAREVLGADAA